jgi:hypothetical protein
MVSQEVVSIDLSTATSEGDLISALGGALQFGGPSPLDNVCVSDAPGQSRGHGFNWDAVIDCCRDLDKGGIWGTSKVFRFPLVLEFRNWVHLKRASGQPLVALNGVLSIVEIDLRSEGKEFRYEFL